MELETFIAGLDRFGADFAGWPADQAGPAQDLVNSSLPARREWLAARKAAALIAAPAPDVATLQRAILARLPVTPAPLAAPMIEAPGSAAATPTTDQPDRQPPEPAIARPAAVFALPRRRSAVLAAGFALAASLMIGVFTGTTGALTLDSPSTTTASSSDDFDQFVSTALTAGDSYGS